MVKKKRRTPGDDPLWFKRAVIYELHVRAFCDSNGDGIGDFQGLTSKLDYLKDLGVTALWLLPFYPSPLRDDGYDIADYSDVHPAYGTLRDFKVFLREAHRRGLRVITELVINHTSDQHAWFQRARRAKKNSPLRDLYVWSDSPEKYGDARIIFKDFETSNWTWDGEAGAYYWHRFYSHQPDLNFENPRVRRAVKSVLDFWLDMGVDGVRLDAVPYLCEAEGTDCENLPATHAFLKELRRHVDSRYKDRMFLAEANQWPEDAIAYFGDGDECHMNFHFPLMPRLFMASRMEDRYPIIDIMRQTPPIPDNCQWAIFLRNHDELTLEMVTDEDRDYMYRVYAEDPQARINLGIKRRLAPLLGNLRVKMELMNGLLFSLPGAPVLYYGDEIGMGDNIYLGDRNGVRTPMQWSPDRNAGFSRTNPQKLFLPVIIDPEYHYESINVESQERNPHSFLWWMKRVIDIRKRHPALSRGSLEFLHPDNRKVLAFLRATEEETLLVVANLSRFVQCVELDLSDFTGRIPVEMFGSNDFPPIGELPYFLTLGPNAFYWFTLEKRAPQEVSPEAGEEIGRRLPLIQLEEDQDILGEGAAAELEAALDWHIRSRRWFGGKARKLKRVSVQDAISVPSTPASLLIVKVSYADGDPETYALPVAEKYGKSAEGMMRDHPESAVAVLERDGASGLLCDAFRDGNFCNQILRLISKKAKLQGRAGRVLGSRTSVFRALAGTPEGNVLVTPMKGEQSNSSVILNERMILKLYRRLHPGTHPEVELGGFLNPRAAALGIPRSGGSITYESPEGARTALAMLQGFIPNEGDAWALTLDELGGYFERVISRGITSSLPGPDKSHGLLGPFLSSVRLLGERTARLHMALSADNRSKDFAPEPITDFNKKSLYHGLVGQAERSLQLLKNCLRTLPPGTMDDAENTLLVLPRIRELFQRVRSRRHAGMRIRCHGDLHLGQVLNTGKDFAIIDFEGEPERSLSYRRIKSSPLRDIAGMLRSFHYAAHAALLRSTAGAPQRPEDARRLLPWAELWFSQVRAAYTGAYLETADGARFLPKEREDFDALLDVFLMEKALYELQYELNNRPDWVGLPLKGILSLLG